MINSLLQFFQTDINYMRDADMVFNNMDHVPQICTYQTRYTFTGMNMTSYLDEMSII